MGGSDARPPSFDPSRLLWDESCGGNNPCIVPFGFLRERLMLTRTLRRLALVSRAAPRWPLVACLALFVGASSWQEVDSSQERKRSQYPLVFLSLLPKKVKTQTVYFLMPCA